MFTKDTMQIPARQEHEITVIFIHGLGQSNATWKTNYIAKVAQTIPEIKWILPQAPDRPVSLNHGEFRPSWFDITSLPPGPDEFDESTILLSISSIEALIENECRLGVATRNIFLMGFSQGASLSLMTAFTSNYSLGGVISLSGWIPHGVRSLILSRFHRENISILWCHGTADTEIPISFGEDALSFLESSMKVPASDIQLITYPGLAHTTCEMEMNDVADWLRKKVEGASATRKLKLI